MTTFPFQKATKARLLSPPISLQTIPAPVIIKYIPILSSLFSPLPLSLSLAPSKLSLILCPSPSALSHFLPFSPPVRGAFSRMDY